MKNTLLQLDKKQGATLQSSIREMIMNAIMDGILSSGELLPSCRDLAARLQVSRNTVAQAYQALNDDGLIMSKSRCGFFVTDTARHNSILKELGTSSDSKSKAPSWLLERIKNPPSQSRFIKKPYNWYEYDFPFLFGQVDRELFPVNAWRECSRQAMSVKNLEQWTGDALDHDDSQLVHYIKSRLLPRRGIGATDEQILITMGTQNGLYLIASLLANKQTVIGIENPGYSDAYYQFSMFSDNIKHLACDENGLKITDEIRGCDILYTTPSYQYPTTATMPLENRQELLAIAKEHKILIFEDDYECESDFENKPCPSLKALDKVGSVIYAGSLSKNLFPALRLGYLVASADIINELRYQRRLVIRHAPMNNQRTAALFLSLGYHQAYYSRLQKNLAMRKKTMQVALKQHLNEYIESVNFGMSSAWIKLKNINSEVLQKAALEKSIIIESGHVFFAPRQRDVYNYVRLGFSSISNDKIAAGIEALAETCCEIRS